MATTSDNDSIGPRLNVGAAMRSFRTEGNFSLDDAAETLGIDRSTVWRKETAEQSTFTALEIEKLAKLYKIPDSDVEGLLAMARQARARKKRGAFPAFVPLRTRAFLELERNLAVEVLILHITLIPLYFQKEKYMRELWLSNGDLLTEEQIDELVRLRKRRQEVVTKPKAPMIRIIMHEAALRLPVGNAALMHEQLLALAAACDLPNVEIQVQPTAAGAYPGMESTFFLLRLAGGPDTDQVETFGYNETFYRDRKSETEPYRVGWARRQVAALDLQASKALILDAAADFAAEPTVNP